MAGGVIAFYQLGYGIAAFGVGPLLDNGVKLTTIYGFAAVIAVVDGTLVIRRCSSWCQRTRASAIGAVPWEATSVNPGEVR